MSFSPANTMRFCDVFMASVPRLDWTLLVCGRQRAGTGRDQDGARHPAPRLRRDRWVKRSHSNKKLHTVLAVQPPHIGFSRTIAGVVLTPCAHSAVLATLTKTAITQTKLAIIIPWARPFNNKSGCAQLRAVQQFSPTDCCTLTCFL